MSNPREATTGAVRLGLPVAERLAVRMGGAILAP